MAPTLTDAEVGLFINGAWVDAVTTADGVRIANPISVRRGRSNWASSPDPSSATFTLDNRDGRWSPRNTAGPYFGHFKRQIPTRVGVGGAPVHLAYNGNTDDGTNALATTPDTPGTSTRIAPTVASITESSTTVAATTHTVNMPATVDRGDRLVLIIISNNSTLAETADLDPWGFPIAEGDIVGSFHYQIWYKTAKGDEDGGSVDFTTGANALMSAQVYRLTGASEMWEFAGVQIEADTADSFTLNPNPPAITPEWGAEATNLFIAGFFAGATGGTVTANPAGYTAGADGNAAAAVWIGTAHRVAGGATEDPAAFTIDDGTAGENVRAFTIAIRGGFATYGDIANLTDLDLRVEYQLDEIDVDTDITVLASNYQEGAGWRLGISREDNGTGEYFLEFRWGNGFFANQRRTNTGGGAVNLPARLVSERSAVRVTLDTDNGAGGADLKFYWADDRAGPWTEIGSGFTEPDPTVISRTEAELHAGTQVTSTGSTNLKPLKGRIYNLQIMESIGSITAEVDVDFEAQTIGAASFTDTTGRTWTIGPIGRITDRQWLFHGELSSIPARWDVQGRDVTAPVTAVGMFSRLRRGKRLESPMTRMAANGFYNIRHWPMEERGNPDRFAIAYPRSFVLNGDNSTNPVLVTTGQAEGAAVDAFVASDPIASLGTSTWTVTAPTYTDVFGGFEVRFNLLIPEPGPATNVEFLTIEADLQWRVEYRTDSGGQLRLIANDGNSDIITGLWSASNLDGVPMRVGIRVQEIGADVRGTIIARTEAGTTPINVNTPTATGTAGPVTSITVNTDQTFEGVGFGQLSLLRDYFGLTPSIDDELAGHAGERAAIRIARLCDEEGISARIIGEMAQSRQLGPQSSGTLMDLVQEAADSDLGVLFEPRESRSIGYRVEADLLGQSPAITADYGAGHLAGSPNLDEDDANLSNDVAVTNWNGTTGRALLNDGSALSVSEPPDGIGIGYDTSFEVNIDDDGDLDAVAARLMDRLTVDEPRISSLRFGLHQPAITSNLPLAGQILDADLGDIVSISNLLTEVIPAGTVIEQIIQGRRDVLGAVTHDVDLLTNPGSPYTELVAMVTQAPAPTIAPGAGGVVRPVTSVAEWNTANTNANPGDVIDVTANITNAAGLDWTTSGADGNPIIITSSNGSVVTATAGDGSDPACIDVSGCTHVHVRVLTTTGGNYSVRYQNVQGSASNPCKISHITSTDTQHAHLVVQDDGANNGSKWIDVEDNHVSGYANASNRFICEGVYVGSGDANYLDPTSHVNVRRNLIHDLASEGIEVKHGARNVNVTHNYIHTIDIEGSSNGPTGAISAWVTPAGAAIPSTLVDAKVYIAGNRLRDCSTHGHGNITFGFGGIDTIGNLIWGHDNWAIRARGFEGASGDAGNVTPNLVSNNTMIGDGYDTGGTGTPAVVVNEFYNVSDPTGSSQYTYDLGTDFIGPTSADAVAAGYLPGFDGDGSGFMLATNSAAIGAGIMPTDMPMTRVQDVPHHGAMPPRSSAAYSYSYPYHSGTTTVVTGNLQTAINASSPGDEIVFSGDKTSEGIIDIPHRIWLRGDGVGTSKVERIETSGAIEGLWLSAFTVERTTPVDSNSYVGIWNPTSGGGALTKFRFFDLEITGHGLNIGIELNRRYDNDRGVIHNVEVHEIENRAWYLHCDNLRTWSMHAHHIYRTVDLAFMDVDAVNQTGSNQHHSNFYFHDIIEADSISTDNTGTASPPHPDGFQTFRELRGDASEWISRNVVFDDGVIDLQTGGRQCFILESNSSAGAHLVFDVTMRRVLGSGTDGQLLNIKGVDGLVMEDCEWWVTEDSATTFRVIRFTAGGGGGATTNPNAVLCNSILYLADGQPFVSDPNGDNPEESGTVTNAGNPPDTTRWTAPTVHHYRPSDAEVVSWMAAAG